MNNIPVEFPEFHHDSLLKSRLDDAMGQNKSLKNTNSLLRGVVVVGGIALIIYFISKIREENKKNENQGRN